MKSMLYCTLFWRMHYEHRQHIQKEKKCKKQFKTYLKYLDRKNIKIYNYVSIENNLCRK